MTTISYYLGINWSGDGVTFVDETAYMFDASISIGMHDRFSVGESSNEGVMASGFYSTHSLGFGAMMSSDGIQQPIGVASGGALAPPSAPSGLNGIRAPQMARRGGGHAAPKAAPKAKKPKVYKHQYGTAPHAQKNTKKQTIPPDRGPIDFIADVGVCSLTLDNASQRFSPSYSSGPLYGLLLPRRAVKLTATDGVSTWPLFVGYIDRIEPEGGTASLRRMTIDCVDAMALLDSQHVAMALQTNVTADVLISALISQVYTPTSTNIQTGTSSFEVAADLWTTDHTTAVDAIRECAESEFGRFFIQQDGTPTFLNRKALLGTGTSALTVDANVPAAIVMGEDIEYVFNVVNTVTHPRNTLSSVIPVAQTPVLVMVPPIGPLGNGIRILTFHFRDDNGNAFGATGLVLPLVYPTDYMATSFGTDMTLTNFTIAASDVKASQITFTMTNSAPVPLYAFVQVRGQVITAYDFITTTVTDSTSVAAYQKRAWTHDLALSANTNLAYSLASYLCSRYSKAFTRVDAVTIHNELTVNGKNVLGVKLFDKITVSEPQAGIASMACWVIGKHITVTPEDFTVMFVTERADDTSYWVLGSSALAQTTRLAV